MESRKFEDAFQDAFKEAEVSPIENVWTNIELDLEKAEGDKMKRRIFFYKLLAAASIAFAMCVAGIGYYIVQNEHRANGQVALHQPDTQAASKNEANASATTANGTTTVNADQQRTENATQDSNPSGLSNNESSQQNQSDPKSIAEQNNNSLTDNTTNSASAQQNEKLRKSQKDGQSVTPIDNKSANKDKNNAVSVQKDALYTSADKITKSNKYTQKKAVEDATTASANGKQNSAVSDRQTIASTEKKNKVNESSDANKITSGTSQSIARNSVANNENGKDAQQKNVASISSGKQQQSVTAVKSNEANKDNSEKRVTGNASQAAIAENTMVNAKDGNATANSQGNNGKNENAIVKGENKNAVANNQNKNAIADAQNINTIADAQNINTIADAQNINTIADAQNKNTSSLTESQRQSVASSEEVKNINSTIDINPFTRYGNTSGEFGAIAKTASASSDNTVKKLPARMDKPEGFDATKLAPEPDPLLAMLARLDAQEKSIQEEQKKEEKNNSEKLWTSVGFAAGSFNTVNSNVSPPSAQTTSFASNNVANQQAKASGSAYTVGISLGTRISKRWIVQGGVNYMTQASDYTSNAVGTSDFRSFSAPNVNSVMSEADSKLVSTAPYTINNNVQFVSIPLQAGYLIVNKRFGVQVNGGVATDMFLQNTLTPESGNVSKTTQGSGADSPYRSLNFSGLVGTEFSYKFGQHYRLSLNPGLRYPFNSIYKSDQPVAAMPLTFDVGLRFRYIFH